MTADALARYTHAWTALTPETIDAFDDVATEDIHFVDPFSDYRGRDTLKDQLHTMFRTMNDPAFAVHDQAMGTKAGYILWTFTGRLKKPARAVRIEGMSEIRFDAEGRAIAHIDHWDAGSQVYAKVPVLGTLIGVVKRKLAHG